MRKRHMCTRLYREPITDLVVVDRTKTPKEAENVKPGPPSPQGVPDDDVPHPPVTRSGPKGILGCPD